MIQDILPRYQTTADGAQTSFTVPFDVIDSSYINVYLGSEKQTAGYTISNKTITFSSAPAENTVVTIVRVVPSSWTREDYGSIGQDTLSNICTQLVAEIQTLKEEISRSVKSPVYSTENGESLSENLLTYLADAVDSLELAKTKLVEVTTAGQEALTAISREKTSSISTINSTASDRIGEYNTNATSKTASFNSNAEDAVDDFNLNATNKTTAFNTNATNKTTAFNTNASQKQALVDASATAAATSETNAATSEANAAASAQAAASSASSISGLAGQIATNTSNISALQTDKQDVITDLATIRSGASAGAGAVARTGDTMSGDLITSGSIYLTSIGSSVSASTSRLYLGEKTNPYTYITGNTNGVFGIYSEVGGTRRGIACYPGQNFFADATTKSMDLGRSNNVWRVIYGNNLSDGASTATVANIISGAALGSTAVQPTNLKTINGNSVLGSGNLEIDGLPSQTGQAGKFLMTNGTNALWEDSKGGYHPDILTYQWSDHLLNNIQWLRSDTFSWQDGTVYETAYQHLVDDLDIRETQVITFGSPKVNPETTSTEYVATRSPENDVISSGLYAWYDSDYDTLYYTQSENPAINDRLYTVNSDPVGYVVKTVTTEDMPSILPTIETVGSYSIVVYIAEDGHKIVLSDQAETVEDIYDESGVAWYFILDTENERFKLPRTKWGFVGLRDGVGNYVPESLPNISGTFDFDSDRNNASSKSIHLSGAFTNSQTGSIRTKGSTIQANNPCGVDFDASRSSSTYQDNAPVQQRATQMYLYFYVGEYAQEAIEQTAGVTTETLSGKADTDLSNVSATGKSTLSEFGFPSNTHIDETYTSSYTAPANGYLYIAGAAISNGGIVALTNTSASFGVQSSGAHSVGYGVYCTIPCKKADIISVYVSQVNISTFRFVYAQGEI